MANRVILTGRLTKDPEVRQTQSGKTVASFTIGVKKRFKPTDGSPDVDFFRCSAWGSTGQFVGNYLTKGRLVLIDGRIEVRTFSDRDNVQRETFEVVAESVEGLDRSEEPAGVTFTAGEPGAS